MASFFLVIKNRLFLLFKAEKVMDEKPLPSNVTKNHYKKTNIAKFILRLHELNLTVENSFFSFLKAACLSHISLNVLILIAFVVPWSCSFENPNIELRPCLFSLPWVLIISPDCRQKTNIRKSARLKTCSLLSWFIVERYLSISCKKIKNKSLRFSWDAWTCASSLALPPPTRAFLISLWLVSWTWMGREGMY